MNPTHKLSPSSINLFLECPRCFWLTKHKKWKRPQGPFPSLPSGMDKILKEHFDRFMEQGKLPPELCEDNKCSDCKLFSDKKLLSVWRNNKKGIEWQDAKGNIIHGAVDNILVKRTTKDSRHGMKLIVLDYKTRGFPLKEDTHEHYQMQMDIYNFLLRKNGYATEDYSLLLFYYPNKVTSTGEVLFDTRMVRMKVDVRAAERVFADAVRLLAGGCPRKGCEWCGGRFERKNG